VAPRGAERAARAILWPMRIRGTVEGDWELLRDIRLRALGRDPQAFGSTLQREQQRTQRQWREWAGRALTGSGATFVSADDADRFDGMVVVIADAERSTTVHLVGMWVDRQARHRGVARALVDAAIRWAHEHGAVQVELSVAEDNQPALALFSGRGFRPTGERHPLPSDPVRYQEALRLNLLSASK
jgi:ribosomal protein S18 acetylase RimI-like enzyme